MQEELVAGDPEVFFRPPYVGHRGWLEVFFRPPYVGHRGWLDVRMDRGLPWQDVAALCREAYRTIAPVTLVRRLDAEA